MEQTWIFFALGGLIVLWLGSFIKKLVVSLWRDKDIFLLTSFLLYVPFFWINMLLQWSMEFNSQNLLPGIVIGFLNFLIPVGTLTALKYLNVSFAFIAMRLTASFLLLLIGVLLLWDSLSMYNYIGFFLGAFALVLLSGFDFAWWSFHWKGIVALVINVIATVLAHAYFKYVVEGVNIHDFMVIQFTTAFVCLIIYMLLRWKIWKIATTEIRKCLPYSLINLVLYSLMYLYFLPWLYIMGPLSLGYKMLSYAIFVPILLSVIFLWEPINKTRMIAFGLTIISIFLFLV